MKDRETDRAWEQYRFGKSTGLGLQDVEESLHAALYKHALRVCYTELNEHRSDIASDACWKAFRNLGGFRGKSKFSTWFHRIVLNTITSAKRTQIRLAEVGLEHAEGHAFTPDAIGPRFAEQLRDVMNKEELALWDFKLRGVGERELAKSLGLTVEGVRSRWFRLRKKLLKHIKS